MKRSVPRLQGLAKRVGKGELIGLPCRIAAAADPGIVGLEGEVIGETLHTIELRLAPGGRRVQVSKRGTTFSFRLPEGDDVEVDGAAIEFRPWDRLKKVR